MIKYKSILITGGTGSFGSAFVKKLISVKKDLKQEINFSIKNPDRLSKIYQYHKSLIQGVFLTRDLISEPPNVLYPKKYKDQDLRFVICNLSLNSLFENKQ